MSDSIALGARAWAVPHVVCCTLEVGVTYRSQRVVSALRGALLWLRGGDWWWRVRGGMSHASPVGGGIVGSSGLGAANLLGGAGGG